MPGPPATAALRPADRRLAAAHLPERRAVAWRVPLGIVAVLRVLSLLTLPTALPP